MLKIKKKRFEPILKMNLIRLSRPGGSRRHVAILNTFELAAFPKAIPAAQSFIIIKVFMAIAVELSITKFL